MQIVSIYPASPEARPLSFFGKLAVRPRSMAGGMPTPCGRHRVQSRTKTNTKNPFTHTHSTPTLSKYTNLSVQPPQSSPPHSPPKSPTSVQPPHPLHQPPHSLPTLLTEYNLHVPTLPTYFHHTNIHTTPPNTNHPLSHTKQTKYLQNKTQRILQLNAIGIRSTVEELKHLIHTTQPDIINIQESNSPPHPGHHKYDTSLPSAQTENTNKVAASSPTLNQTQHSQTTRRHKSSTQKYNFSKYTQTLQGHHHSQHIHTTTPHHDTIYTIYTNITSCIQYITNIPNSINTGDVNAHSTLWHLYTDDHRGELISETLSNSNHITLNTDSPTIVPNNAHQQPTSPDITTISSSLYNRTTCKTIHALNSDHLPILLTIQTDNKHTLQQNRRSYTNYRKADWDKFTQDTEDAFTAIQPPTDIHDANKTFTNILYQAGENTYQ